MHSNKLVGRHFFGESLTSAIMLGEEIRKARLDADLTQEELAFKADVSRQYVSLLELNQKSPTVDVLIRPCKAMKVSAGQMISRVESVKPKRRG